MPNIFISYRREDSAGHIGRQWLDVGVARGRRPGEAEDYIRLEIVQAEL